MVELNIIHNYQDFPFDNCSYLQVIALVNERLVGTAKVECWGTGADYHPFVSKVWVDPDYRGQGIGKALMNYVIETAIKNGNITLALYVHRANKVARNLYESLGFFAITIDEDLQIMYARQLEK